jgi:hypothetical protein
MAVGARFAKWGLGLFIFGVFLTFGIIGHYCSGARWPTGELFMQNITLWWACPWTLSVAAVQAGGLGMVALGLTRLLAARLSPDELAAGEGRGRVASPHFSQRLAERALWERSGVSALRAQGGGVEQLAGAGFGRTAAARDAGDGPYAGTLRRRRVSGRDRRGGIRPERGRRRPWRP